MFHWKKAGQMTLVANKGFEIRKWILSLLLTARQALPKSAELVHRSFISVLQSYQMRHMSRRPAEHAIEHIQPRRQTRTTATENDARLDYGVAKTIMWLSLTRTE